MTDLTKAQQGCANAISRFIGNLLWTAMWGAFLMLVLQGIHHTYAVVPNLGYWWSACVVVVLDNLAFHGAHTALKSGR